MAPTHVSGINQALHAADSVQDCLGRPAGPELALPPWPTGHFPATHMQRPRAATRCSQHEYPLGQEHEQASRAAMWHNDVRPVRWEVGLSYAVDFVTGVVALPWVVVAFDGLHIYSGVIA